MDRKSSFTLALIASAGLVAVAGSYLFNREDDKPRIGNVRPNSVYEQPVIKKEKASSLRNPSTYVEKNNNISKSELLNDVPDLNNFRKNYFPESWESAFYDTVGVQLNGGIEGRGIISLFDGLERVASTVEGDARKWASKDITYLYYNKDGRHHFGIEIPPGNNRFEYQLMSSGDSISSVIGENRSPQEGNVLGRMFVLYPNSKPQSGQLDLVTSIYRGKELAGEELWENPNEDNRHYLSVDDLFRMNNRRVDSLFEKFK